jgi:dephospho-CoA kinase
MAAKGSKFIIGLTGNIATGKSVVRKMLEHLGAYGIDADALTHRVMSQGAPGYQPIIDEFGKYILDPDQQIDRKKLGNLVFADPDALVKLESIVHPFVRQAVDHLIQNATQKVVVVEAIKLLESPLREKVDKIWVTVANESSQLSRLVEKRGMSQAEARQRMENQSPQSDKIAAADVIIKNDGTYDETWKQVQDAWKKQFPKERVEDTVEMEAVARPEGAAPVDVSTAKLTVHRAKPRQAEDIANFINRMSGGKLNLTRMDIMAAFGEKAYMLLKADDSLVGLVGWQVENLVSRTDEVWLEKSIAVSSALTALMVEVEEASKELQAEAALVFVSPEIAKNKALWGELGYEDRSPESLTVNAWKEAANSMMKKGAVLLFKQLRVDRVLRPI